MDRWHKRSDSKSRHSSRSGSLIHRYHGSSRYDKKSKPHKSKSRSRSREYRRRSPNSKSRSRHHDKDRETPNKERPLYLRSKDSYDKNRRRSPRDEQKRYSTRHRTKSRSRSRSPHSKRSPRYSRKHRRSSRKHGLSSSGKKDSYARPLRKERDISTFENKRSAAKDDDDGWGMPTKERTMPSSHIEDEGWGTEPRSNQPQTSVNPVNDDDGWGPPPTSVTEKQKLEESGRCSPPNKVQKKPISRKDRDGWDSFSPDVDRRNYERGGRMAKENDKKDLKGNDGKRKEVIKKEIPRKERFEPKRKDNDGWDTFQEPSREIRDEIVIQDEGWGDDNDDVAKPKSHESESRRSQSKEHEIEREEYNPLSGKLIKGSLTRSSKGSTKEQPIEEEEVTFVEVSEKPVAQRRCDEDDCYNVLAYLLQGDPHFRQFIQPSDRKPRKILLEDITDDDITNDPRKRIAIASLAGDGKRHKPNLVLDLDYTLIQGFVESDRNPIPEYVLKGFETPEIKANLSETDFQNGEMKHKIFVVFRNQLHNFLKEMSPYYNFHLYSHGYTKYVEKILTILEEKEKYIRRDRMITNDGGITHKDSKSLLKFNNPDINQYNSLILDDTVEVWNKEYRECLIPSKKFMSLPPQDMNQRLDRYPIKIWEIEDPVQPRRRYFQLNSYEYFEESMGHDHPQLFHLQDFLKRVGKIYEQRYVMNHIKGNKDKIDIKTIMAEETGKILQGCSIYLNLEGQSKDNRESFEYIIEYLGGNKVSEISQATHIITESYVDNVQTALENVAPCQLLPRWLSDCFFSIKRMDEKDNYYIIAKEQQELPKKNQEKPDAIVIE